MGADAVLPAGVEIVSNLQISEIGQIAIVVEDLERATAFYRDTLGMHFLFQVPRMAFFDVGGVRLMLGLPEGVDKAATSTIYYRVGDLVGAYEQLAGRGVEFVEKPHLVARMEDHDLWMAFFHDTEGNLLALMSELPRRRGKEDNG
jgi:catechol 2,3-dioxygenase-like lactoylglutathione lyase family enzyme